MFNSHVQIYIGDLKFNQDSHRFIEDVNSVYVTRFDNKIDFVDIDYLGLDCKSIANIVANVNKKVMLVTLFPEKIDTKLECKINYKDHAIKKYEMKIYDIVKCIFIEKNRMKVFAILMHNNANPHMLNKWLQSNPSALNLGALQMSDYYVDRIPPALYLSLIAFNVTSGPSYISYAFKKNIS